MKKHIRKRRRVSLQEAVQGLRDFYQRHQRPPSYDEIRVFLGYRSKNAAFWMVRRLKEKGILQSDTRGKLMLESLAGIRLLGAVQAGFPSPAEEELVDTLSLDQYLVSNPSQSYLIRVTGDSMVDAGIHEGDLVIVERGREPKNHDIVVAQVDGEWTMKYYRKTQSKIALIPANPKYPTLYPTHELIVGGVVVSVIRKYK